MRKNGKSTALSALAGDTGGHRCEWPGCISGGVYRAPRSRDEPGTYRWFCLDHVRGYNASWNYYAGMSEAEIEADVRRDAVWGRPSWPLGSRADRLRRLGSSPWDDAFGVFGNAAAAVSRRPDATPEEKAMVVLDLRPPLTTQTVRSRYRELVKRHHPDANGGDKAAEEKFKQIHDAYETIMDSLTASG